MTTKLPSPEAGLNINRVFGRIVKGWYRFDLKNTEKITELVSAIESSGFVPASITPDNEYMLEQLVGSYVNSKYSSESQQAVLDFLKRLKEKE